MDVVSLFALLVFGCGWYFLGRTSREETLVRLFFGTIMFMGAAIGVLGLLLRLMR
jgi:hypothetical protein